MAAPTLAVRPYVGRSHTWLHLAGETGDAAFSKAALDAGIDPHTRDDNHESTLHTAAYGASMEVASLLIDRGLTVDLRDQEGKTPLHCARGATIAFLLECGASVSARDIHGNSPLHGRLDRRKCWRSRCVVVREWRGMYGY